MGLFSTLFGSGKQLNIIANGVANITNLLDEYENDNDPSYIYFSAWICRIAILDVVERNKYPLTYKLFVHLHGHHQRMMLTEAYMLTLTRIINKASQRGSRIQQFTQDILDKGDAFYEIDKQIPDDKKQIFK